jgi:hypothetical protein
MEQIDYISIEKLDFLTAQEQLYADSLLSIINGIILN